MSKCCDERGRCLKCGAPVTFKTFTVIHKGKQITRAAKRCTNPKCSNY